MPINEERKLRAVTFGRRRMAIVLLAFCGASAVLSEASNPPNAPAWTEENQTSGGAVLHGVSVTRSNQAIIINVNAKGPVRVTAGRLTTPERIYVDLQDTQYLGHALRIPVPGGDVLEVRVAQLQRQPAIARIVVDLSRRLPFEIVSFSKGLAIQVNIGPENPEVAAESTPAIEAAPTAATIAPATSLPAPPRELAAPPVDEPGPPTATQPEAVPQVLIGELQSPISGFSAPEIAPIPPAAAENLSPDEDGPTTPHQAAKANLPVSISAVTVSRQPREFDVHIEATGRLRPTARVFANPDRIVVDLANAYCDRERRIPVHRGDVKDVGVSLFLLNPPVTRIVLTLTRPHAYHLLGSGSSLTIRVDAQQATRTQAQPASSADHGDPVTLLREPPTR